MWNNWHILVLFKEWDYYICRLQFAWVDVFPGHLSIVRFVDPQVDVLLENLNVSVDTSTQIWREKSGKEKYSFN